MPVNHATLLEALQASLDNAVVDVVETHGCWDTILANAAARLGRVISLHRRDTLALVPGTEEYPLPDDFIGYEYSDWGQSTRRQHAPWDLDDTDELPAVSDVDNSDASFLVFEPAPSAAQIARFGTQYRYRYRARHTLTSDTSTIPAREQDIFILIAQIEVMLLVAKRNSTKPVQLRDGYSGAPKNGTPAALAEQLNELLETQLGEHRRAA